MANELKKQNMVDDSHRTYDSYDLMAIDARGCTRCDLCETRTNVVVGGESLNAQIMVVGEAPGANEDETGIPFIGRGGQMLMRLFSEVGIVREDLYITNVVKCRPPENRNPTAFEIRQCTPFLNAQIQFVNPAVIVPVGNFASRYILDTKSGITTLRGKVYDRFNRKVIPTVHPAFVLRNGARGESMMLDDLKLVSQTLKQ